MRLFLTLAYPTLAAILIGYIAHNFIIGLASYFVLTTLAPNRKV